MSNVEFLRVESERCDQRIDNFLLGYWKKLPKSRVYRLLRKGEVRVNGKRVKPEYRLQTDDQLRLPPVTLPDTLEPKAVPGQQLRHQLNRAIVYEDEVLVAFNKPSGLAVHGGSGIHLGLIESYRAMHPEQRFVELVHRLDRDTSGVVLMAKKRSALKTLQEAFRQKTQVKKVYWCLVSGRWSSSVHHVSAPLLKQQAIGGERRVSVNDEGKASLTRFRTLGVYNSVSWLEAQPVTGRTHQIRVHCQFAGHPILGDTKYQSPEAEVECRKLNLSRLFLHAVELTVLHPVSGESLTIQAPLDKSLHRLLQRLKASQENKDRTGGSGFR